MQSSNKNREGNSLSEFIGIVLEDKAPNSRVVKVHCPELQPYLEGEVGPAVQDKQVSSGENGDGYVGKVTTTNVIEAIYGGRYVTNRIYPPDVKKKEQVIVYSFGDSDTYYWDTLGRDDRLRRTERYTVAISDTPDAVDTLTVENTYQFEMDTLHNKHILLRTCKSSQEEFQYLVKLDAKESTVTVCDDVGNEFRIESKTPRILMRNKDGCFLDLVQKKGVLCVPEDLLIKAGDQIVWDTPAFTFKNNSGQGATVFNTNNMVVNAGSSFVVDAPMFNHKGGLTKLENVTAQGVKAEALSMGGYGSNMTSTTIDVNKGYNKDASPSFPTEDTSHRRSGDNTMIDYLIRAVEALCDVVDTCDCGLSTAEPRRLCELARNNNRVS